MIFMWDSNIVHLSASQCWHLEFADFENNGVFELRLFVNDSETEGYLIDSEDACDFEQFVKGEYPYFLFDYGAELVREIGSLIKGGADFIDVGSIVEQVRNKWVS